MTKTEQAFMEALRDTKGSKKVKWKQRQGYIRADVTIQDFDGERVVECCPLTAICHVRTGKYYMPHDYKKAALCLGTNVDELTPLYVAADNIAFAADTPPEDIFNAERRELRKGMIRALGLMEYKQ